MRIIFQFYWRFRYRRITYLEGARVKCSSRKKTRSHQMKAFPWIRMRDRLENFAEIQSKSLIKGALLIDQRSLVSCGEWVPDANLFDDIAMINACISTRTRLSRIPPASLGIGRGVCVGVLCWWAFCSADTLRGACRPACWPVELGVRLSWHGKLGSSCSDAHTARKWAARSPRSARADWTTRAHLCKPRIPTPFADAIPDRFQQLECHWMIQLLLIQKSSWNFGFFIFFLNVICCLAGSLHCLIERERDGLRASQKNQTSTYSASHLST